MLTPAWHAHRRTYIVCENQLSRLEHTYYRQICRNRSFYPSVWLQHNHVRASPRAQSQPTPIATMKKFCCNIIEYPRQEIQHSTHRSELVPFTHSSFVIFPISFDPICHARIRGSAPSMAILASEHNCSNPSVSMTVLSSFLV
jgi:hypothetical protein